MKITLTIALLFTIGFLFAQKDAPVKGIPVKVGKDGKISIMPLAPKDSPTIAMQIDSAKRTTTITIAKNQTVYTTKMSFWEKCTYWFFWFKKDQPFMFWSLLVIIGFWILKLLFKVLGR